MASEATRTLAALIQKCAASTGGSRDALRRARQIHAVIVTTAPPRSPPFLNNNLLTAYARCGCLEDARRVFEIMPQRNIVTYNALISASSRAPSHAPSALSLLPDMVSVGLRPNSSTLSSLLQASSSLVDRSVGAMLHSQVVSCGFSDNVCIQTSLLGMYSDCGDLEAANRVFSDMVERDTVAWNSIILGNVKNSSAKRGLRLFSGMVTAGSAPTHFTFSIVLNACRRSGDQRSGKIVHAQIIKSDCPADIPLQNALLDMYSSWGDLAAARAVYRNIETPNLVSWNTMIARYSDNGDGKNAMDLFIQLRTMSLPDGSGPDEYTFAATVSATAALPAMIYGKPLHAQVAKDGLECSVFVGSTLINMYFKNQEPDSAQKLFDWIPEKDVVIWTEMIAGHTRLGEGETAITYMYRMQEEGHRVDSFSLSSSLNSAADLAVLKQGEMIHSQVVKMGCEADMCVCGGLIDMYAKNGALEAAASVFHGVADPDLKCWNSMLGGYGHHGNAEQAFEIFNGILEQGMEPDHVTFVSLLSACSHCGLVETGRLYWDYMMGTSLVPGPKHYACMVSLLSRAGLLREAEELIVESPFVDNSTKLWRILLSSCVVFRDLGMGIHAAEKILMLDSDDSTTHILLSNLYASVGRWEAVADMRRKIRGLVMEKDPGLSWTEIKSEIHVFSADDESHPGVDNARAELQRLQGNLEGWETFESTSI